MNRKDLLLVLGAILIITTSFFYWFEYRPSNIRKECAQKGIDITKDILNTNVETALSTGDYIYKSCVRSKGISQ